jgi:hypothetical protein
MSFVSVEMALNDISLVSLPVILHIHSSVIRKTAFPLRLSVTSLVTYCIAWNRERNRVQ